MAALRNFAANQSEAEELPALKQASESAQLKKTLLRKAVLCMDFLAARTRLTMQMQLCDWCPLLSYG